MLDGIPGSIASNRTEEMLERVGLSGRSCHYPAQLSGGEMQRAALARAVVARPSLIIADEPTGNLDSENGIQVMNLLEELNRELGLTIILATHSNEASQYAGRLLRMRDGVIEEIL
jgi:predicted ABC-type transport system involved in lysophospholipase L1 biosynthesis ATPase subunit